MGHYDRNTSGWKVSEYSGVRSEEYQGRSQLPTLSLIEQSVTILKGAAQYLVRAYVRLGSPLILYPFEVVEIVPVDCPQQFRWRVPAGSVTLSVPSANDWPSTCDGCLKNWAMAFVGTSAAAA